MLFHTPSLSHRYIQPNREKSVVSVADKDDAPGAVGFGLIFILASIVVATFAAVLQKLVQNGLDMKSENELTV